MRKVAPYIIFLLVFLTVISSCRRGSKPVLPPLTESYRKSDKHPFGSFVAFSRFGHLFNDRYVEVVTEPFDDTWSTIASYPRGQKYSLYVLIAKNLVLNSGEVKAFADFVKAGNDLFISADYIDSRFLDYIDCNTERDDEILQELNGVMRTTSLKMYFGDSIPSPSYSYYYYPFLNALSGYDPASARVLGTNENNQPDYIVLFSGRGRIYLHVAPRIFGNYFILTGENYKYFDNVISSLRPDPQNIYWDEYYKTAAPSRRSSGSNSGNNDFSTLSVIKKYPPLQWAFGISVAGLLLFIFFNSRRKQRIIPVVKPVQNTTLTFTQTVGRLYLQKKNNRRIAEKMITYFYEDVRNKYFVSTATIDDNLVNILSGKSGISAEKTRELFSIIKLVQSGVEIDDATLLTLSANIENFTKTSFNGRKAL